MALPQRPSEIHQRGLWSERQRWDDRPALFDHQGRGLSNFPQALYDGRPRKADAFLSSAKPIKTMRKLKKEIRQLLEQDDFEMNHDRLFDFPLIKSVNALLPILCTTDPILKKHAAMAIGEVVSRMAENDFESARIIMRRLIFQLNDESGGIGWGAPIAMGEIMARNQRLADEYHKILLSYAKGGGNAIDFEELQKDVGVALKRLKEAYPHLVQDPSNG